VGARSKKASNTKRAEDFDVERLLARLRMPRDGRNTIDSWSLAQIWTARQDQMRGFFVEASRMAEQMRTDDALFSAYTKRLAPRRVIPVEMKSVGGSRGDNIAAEADALYGAKGVAFTEGTLADIHSDIVNHGVAFAVNDATVRDDGSRIDLHMRYWPIEYVRWDPVFRIFKARADPNTVQDGDLLQETPEAFETFGTYNEFGFIGSQWIPVIHGDGRWIIFTKHDLEPFRKEAALLPAALVWARHAFAARDWSKGSLAHGTAKMIGELPAGVPLQNAAGLTAEAQAMIALLQAIVAGDTPVGIRPAGSKTDFVTNTSTAWQVWKELVDNAEGAAEKIYLGTDAALGAKGGAPGVDIGELFGVAKTLVRSDLQCISRGIDTGLIQPWAAMNFGDSKFAPSRAYLVPNDDEEELIAKTAERNKAFAENLKTLRDAGLTVTSGYIAQLAEDYGVRCPAIVTPPAAPVAAPHMPAQPATLSAIVTNTIRKVGSKWVVYSEGGKRLGEYDTKEEAEKRLRQVEYYKNAG
jgi:hypothetical protein